MSIPLGVTASAVVPAAWTPASIANLKGWWDADDASTFTYSSGVLVSQWRDKSGQARHFAQGTTARQPSRSATINGKSAVAFTKANTNYMDTASFTQAQPLTMLVVVDAAAGFGGWVTSVGGDLQAVHVSDQIRTYGGGGGELVSSAVTAGVHQVSMLFNGASSQTWADGASIASGTDLGANGTTTGLRLGAERNLHPAYFFGGSLAEIVVYSGALGATDRQTVEAYLKAKWGTP